MADEKRLLPENVVGDFFVDDTCIDCGTCRHLAPTVFAETEDYSYVAHQPDTEPETKQALYALLSCPTGSIGTHGPNRARQVIQAFPLPLVDEEVYYCGFTSPKSYGASSYLIRHPDGNWLIDAPKALPSLMRKFEDWGGIHTIFLTHSDDVGDTQRYAEHFGARRIIHQQELWAQPGAEPVIQGQEPQLIHPDFLVIPTPGHTRGHCALLYRNRVLFTGDHLWWNEQRQRLEMPTHIYWNQAEQVKSSKKLLSYPFEWVMPGHGGRVHLPGSAMQQALTALIARSA